MYRIIGGDRQQYGPVSADEVRQWISQGRLTGQSLALIEGGEWKPLSTFPEFAEALRIQTASPPPGLTPASAQQWTAETLASQPALRVGECLSRGWSLVTSNFGLLFGACCLLWVLRMALERIPIIGWGVWFVLQGVFYGGLYVIFLKRIRGQTATVGDLFSGFSSNFGQLLLVGFLTGLLAFVGLFCCLLPGIYLKIAWIFAVAVVADKGLEFWSGMELSRKLVTRVWFEALGLILLAFLPTILAFLAVQAKTSVDIFPQVWQMANSGNPMDINGLMRVIQQSAQFAPPVWLELFPRFVLLLNLPWAIAALMYGYENLFGARTPAAA